MAKAEKAWKADEAARLVASEAQWQEKSAKALAEARAQSDAGLSKTEKAWRADETARLAAAETQWQEKSAKALTEASAQSEVAFKHALSNAELARDSGNANERRLREELAQAHSDLEQARERWQQESAGALSKAKEGWKAEEEARFAAAEAEWQATSKRALAEATERFGEAALKQLRSKAEQYRQGELDRAQKQLARGEDPAKVVEQLAQSLTNKFLHHPLSALNRAQGARREALADALEEIYPADSDNNIGAHDANQ